MKAIIQNKLSNLSRSLNVGLTKAKVKYIKMEKRQKIIFLNILAGSGFILILLISTLIVVFSGNTHSKNIVMSNPDQAVFVKKAPNPYVVAIDSLKGEMIRHSDQTSKEFAYQFEQMRKEIQKGIAESNNDESIQAYKKLESSISQQLALINNSLNSNSDQYNAYLGRISEQLVAIQKAQAQEKKQLNPDVLSFVVLGVDWWNGVQKINVQNKNDMQYGLVTQGQNYDNWIATGIDSSHKNMGTHITFVSATDKNKIVVVVL
ncbi:MAG: hypothetical protein ACJA0H_000491 [Francisellaceae bacterium]|jgi:hypothetical protein